MALIPASYIEKSWRKAIHALEYGTLTFVAPNGEVTVCQGAHPGPSARFHIHEWDVLRRIMARGDIGLGEEIEPTAGACELAHLHRIAALEQHVER